MPEEKLFKARQGSELDKTGELRVPDTRCDLCGRPSVVILSDGGARCESHILSKEAGSEVRLKSAGECLASCHDA